MGGAEVNTKRIKVTQPFTYWLNGYERRDFAIGEYDVPYDCAAYAEKGGFTKTEAERKAEEERQKVEADRKAEEEGQTTEADQKTEAEQKEKGENDGGTSKPARGKKASES